MDSHAQAPANHRRNWTGQPPNDPHAADIRAAQAGCELALGRLFDAYRDYLLKVANNVLPTHVRGKFGPSDVVQETMLQVGRDFVDFTGNSDEDLKVWMREALVRHARNMTRTYTRTKMRHLGREVSLEEDEGQTPHSIAADAPRSPIQRVAEEEESAALMSALSRLPEPHREVIVLRHWKGWSFLQIGKALGRSDDAVRKIWARALVRLKKELPAAGRIPSESYDG